ncbi:MAG: hypothetical protein C0438_06410 [Pseudomonas sp.]|nr:hypothetical protein [Pseudomonas sp.]
MIFPCGSEPARESGLSDTFELNDTPHSRAGSLPQGERGCSENWRRHGLLCWFDRICLDAERQPRESPSCPSCRP